MYRCILVFIFNISDRVSNFCGGMWRCLLLGVFSLFIVVLGGVVGVLVVFCF